MFKLCYILIICQLLYIIHTLPDNHLSCSSHPNTNTSVQIFFNRRRNETGSWVHILKAQTIVNNTEEQINLKLTHTTLECEGRRIITIQGVYDPYEDISRKKLLFHKNCGKNVKIVNEGRTVQRKGKDGWYTAAFTNRPLYDDEIFEVILEKLEDKGTWWPQIGVITKSPENITIKSDFSSSPDSVVYVGKNLHVYGGLKSNIFVKSTADWKEGEKLGVMKSASGKLYFFYNGENLGEAASGLPPVVYGLFELFGRHLKASIVHSS